MKTFKQHKELQKKELLARLGANRERCINCGEKINPHSLWSNSTWVISYHNSKFDESEFCDMECWLQMIPRKKHNIQISRDPVRAPIYGKQGRR